MSGILLHFRDRRDIFLLYFNFRKRESEIKYLSTDHLHDFEFHDAEFTFVSLTDDHLTVSARCLNIHKGTVQNPYPADMEIESASITFHHFSIKSFEPGRIWTTDETGQLCTEDPEIIYTGEEAVTRFLSVLREGFNIYQLESDATGICRICAGCFIEPYFEAQWTFSSVTVEWDEYSRIAWYEEHQRVKK